MLLISLDEHLLHSGHYWIDILAVVNHLQVRLFHETVVIFSQVVVKIDILTLDPREQYRLIFVKVLVLRDVAMHLQLKIMALWVDAVLHKSVLKVIKQISSTFLGFV